MTDTLTSTEAAKALGVSKRTVHRMALDGRLKYQRLGSGALVFKRSAVERAKTSKG